MTSSTTSIRRAQAHEAAELTALTIRSKAWWGYDPAFMARAAPELTFHPSRFEPEFLVYVSERDGCLAGFYGLIPLNQDQVQLNDLFVDPVFIGTGIGAELWHHAVETARSRNYRAILLSADPNAETFYRKQGAVTIGSVPSTVETGRILPRMEYLL
jgi:GNAT superfamily N-acetyltransferase